MLHVAWRDGYWTVRAGDEARIPALAAAAGRPAAVPESLGILHLQKDVSDFPAGELRPAAARGRTSRCRSRGARRRPRRRSTSAGADAPVLLAVAGPVWPADAEKPLPPAAMALFDGQGRAAPRAAGGPAGARGAQPAGGEALGAAGAGLGRPAGGQPAARECGRMEHCCPRRRQPRARQGAGAADLGLVPPAGDGAGDGRMILGLWLRPRPALRADLTSFAADWRRSRWSTAGRSSGGGTGRRCWRRSAPASGRRSRRPGRRPPSCCACRAAAERAKDLATWGHRRFDSRGGNPLAFAVAPVGGVVCRFGWIRFATSLSTGTRRRSVSPETLDRPELLALGDGPVAGPGGVRRPGILPPGAALL